MKLFLKKALVFCLALFILSACNAPSVPTSDLSDVVIGEQTEPLSPPEEDPASVLEEPTETAKERAEKLVAAMNTEEKIGQVLLMDFRQWAESGAPSEDGKNTDMQTENGHSQSLSPTAMTVLNNEVASIIADYHLGSVILFAENCTDPVLLTHFTYDLQRAALDAGSLPLLIGADQESGNITRLAFGCCMSGNMAVGLSGNVQNAVLTGKVIGSELSAVGINTDFAPVADVNSNPKNPVIGMRSFGDDPNLVAEMSAAMASAMKDEGVIACAKHFPGHGNTDTDSHSGLPLVEESYEEWLSLDGLPFKTLVENKIPMIMTAHIQYPGLDNTTAVSRSTGETIYLPATLSHRILTDILKDDLGFAGVVVTDAMNMDAIAVHFGKSDAVIRALSAGADLICIPVSLRSMADVPALEKLYADIKTALSDGSLSMERLDDAVCRVVTMKIEAGLLDADYDYDVDKAAETAFEVVGGPEHRAIERKVADNCVSLQYDGSFVPFAPNSGESVVVLMPYDNEVTSIRYAFQRMEREGIAQGLSVRIYSYQNMEALTSDLMAAVQSADYLIVGSEELASTMNSPNHWLNTIPKAALAAAQTDRVAVLCTGLPYQAAKYKDTYPTFVLGNYSGMDESDLTAEKFTHKYGPAIPAGIDKIFGR